MWTSRATWRSPSPWNNRVKTQDYARWFRASTPYISAHRGKTFVALLGGEALMHGNLPNIVHDLALLHVLGVRLVLVHGARPQIDAALPGSRFHSHQGISRRITDPQAMPVVAEVCGRLRTDLEALFSTGLPSSPLHNTEIQLVSGNFVVARPAGVLEGVDHQLTGQPRRIRADAIGRLLDLGAIALLSPLGFSPSGQAFNLMADELAEHAALALSADKLIAFDDAPYLADAKGARLSSLSPGALERALPDSAASEATKSRLRMLLRAVRRGVASGQLVSYQDDGALLEELFTADGVGTQVAEQDARRVRRAELRDVADIVEIIRPLEDAGALVRRSRDRLEREIDRFFVAELDGIVTGCCALYPAPPGVELACIAVHPAQRGGNAEPGLGKTLLAAAEQAAKAEGFEFLFVLTTQTRDWFMEQGFRESAIDDLPSPRQALYNYERNATVLVKQLDARLGSKTEK